jgi:hypothetical protein
MNKKKKKRGDSIWIGILIGVCSPLLTAYMFFSSFYTGEEGFIEGIQAVASLPPLMSKFMIVCLLPNIILIYSSYKFELWTTYKGIVACTMFYIIPTVYFFA